jgi:hypothetical protein
MSDLELVSMILNLAGENLLGRSPFSPKILEAGGLFFLTACFQLERLPSTRLPYISYLLLY